MVAIGGKGRGQAARVVVGTAIGMLDLSETELWVDYANLGGEAGPELVHRMLEGLGPVRALEYNLLALALNDRFERRWGCRPVPYSEELGG